MMIRFFMALIHNKWIKGITQFVIVLSCAWYIFQNLKQINLQLYQINFLNLIAALFITMIGTSLGATSWWLTLRVFGQRPEYSRVCNIQYKSSLAKYLPGYGWQLIGKNYLSINEGIPASTTVVAIIFEYMEIFFTGLFLAAIFFPVNINLLIPEMGKFSNYLLSFRIFSYLLLFLAPLIFIHILRVFYKRLPILRISWKWIILLVGLLVITWMINSFGFYQLFYVVGKETGIDFRFTIFSLVIAFLIGLAIIIVPGSIGIREFIFVILLSPIIGTSQAGLIAILYRIITILSEIFVFLLSKYWIYRLNKAK